MIWNDSETTSQATQTTPTLALDPHVWLELADLLAEPVERPAVEQALQATDGDPLAIARRLFPALSDEALQELLWALGERERCDRLLPC